MAMLFPRSTGILLHPTSFPRAVALAISAPPPMSLSIFWRPRARDCGRCCHWVRRPRGIPRTPRLRHLPAIRCSSAWNVWQSMAGWMRLQLAGLPRQAGAIDYEQVFQRKLPLIVARCPELSCRMRGATPRSRFEHFCGENAWWLEEFVLFDALRERYAQEMLEGVAARPGSPRSPGPGHRPQGTGRRDGTAARDPVLLL